MDLVAQRGEDCLYAEAKARTAAIGLDVDTLYGQLLQRMPDDSGTARYGVVVPTAAVKAALRVPEWALQRLRIDVFEVTDNGEVIGRWIGRAVNHVLRRHEEDFASFRSAQPP